MKIGFVVNAIETGGAEPAQIRDAIEGTTEFHGIGGTFNFSAESHYGLSPDAFVMITIKDGEWALPEGARTQPLRMRGRPG